MKTFAILISLVISFSSYASELEERACAGVAIHGIDYASLIDLQNQYIADTQEVADLIEKLADDPSFCLDVGQALSTIAFVLPYEMLPKFQELEARLTVYVKQIEQDQFAQPVDVLGGYYIASGILAGRFSDLRLVSDYMTQDFINSWVEEYATGDKSQWTRQDLIYKLMWAVVYSNSPLFKTWIRNISWSEGESMAEIADQMQRLALDVRHFGTEAFLLDNSPSN